MNWLSCTLLSASITLSADDSAKVPAVTSHEFLARIVSIEPRRFPAGSDGIVIDADARWALKLEVTKIAPGHPKFAVGDTVFFGIHSPSRFFMSSADELVGKKWSFTFKELGSPRLSANRRQAE
jgi:hypothetical protein